MGFPGVSIKIPKSVTVALLLNLLGHLKFMVVAALAHLGLFNRPEQTYAAEHEHPTNYVLVIDWPSPLPVPIPVRVLKASIKKRLPVLKYGNFVDRLGGSDGESTACAVCLDCVERSHEIRELPNCCHVFHKECLDNWVEEDQVTCPLCRSMLFPDKRDMTSWGGARWMIERNAYSFGEDYAARTS